MNTFQQYKNIKKQYKILKNSFNQAGGGVESIDIDADVILINENTTFVDRERERIRDEKREVVGEAKIDGKEYNLVNYENRQIESIDKIYYKVDGSFRPINDFKIISGWNTRNGSPLNIVTQYVVQHDVQHFLEQQEANYAVALSEINAGRKSGHWVWYIFPQVQLGTEIISIANSIKNLNHARQYLKNETLYKRLLKINMAVNEQLKKEVNMDYMMGYPDNMKYRSSATLFIIASYAIPKYKELYDVLLNNIIRFSKYKGKNRGLGLDKRTIDKLKENGDEIDGIVEAIVKENNLSIE